MSNSVIVNNFMRRRGLLVKNPEGLYNSAWVGIVLDFSVCDLEDNDGEAKHPDFDEAGEPDNGIRYIAFQWISQYEEVERITRGTVDNHEHYEWTTKGQRTS